MNTLNAQGWTWKSVTMAVAVSLALLLIVMRLDELGLWPDLLWGNVILPASGGAVFLTMRHRESWLLSFALFMPLMTLLLLFVGLSMPGSDL